jgi:hypothetical protein
MCVVLRFMIVILISYLPRLLLSSNRGSILGMIAFKTLKTFVVAQRAFTQWTEISFADRREKIKKRRQAMLSLIPCPASIAPTRGVACASIWHPAAYA